ncbi:conserved protein of unknown function [Nitrospira japonica]|uniref:Uncharacterized protein n=1 Tax=Nitrospira japonica TaxID=1325564 RepID=A0A1W1I7D4_9BACT|nr:hypothetical protein [Nitrospira japonica]SLM48723.1 conserved protein of unknown function [Nitrospira japonica]
MNQTKLGLCVAVVVCLMLAFGGPMGTLPLATAEEPQLDLNSPDVIKQVLDQQVGKRVKVKLKSGQDIEGKVARVGSHAVHLTELSGMEFFDATVKVDDVTTVIVKVRTK